MSSRGPSRERWKKTWELFHGALELDASERAGYLEAACGGDEELRSAVEELLATRDHKPDALDRLGQAVGNLIGELRDTGGAPSRRRPELPAGTVLADRFEIVRHLDSGGMGAVYEARDRELGIPIALKLLHPDLARDAEARERFRREIHLARRVTHPNACRIFDLFRVQLSGPGDAGRGEEIFFLTMELLEGETLKEHLRREGPMEAELARGIAIQIADALTCAHEVGVIHRDLKSANIMLQHTDEGIRAVVMDFGIATSHLPEDAARAGLTLPGNVLGTPEYMAPEQLEGGEVTPATDIYSFGLILFEMLTGELPFQNDSPIAVLAERIRRPAPRLRAKLAPLGGICPKIVARCLEAEADQRFRSARELRACLRDQRLAPRLGSRRRTAVRLGLLAGALLLIALPFAWPFGETTGPTRAGATAAADELRLVLITELEEPAGEAGLASGLRHAFVREVMELEDFAPVPPRRLRETLARMRLPSDARIDAGVGLGIGARDSRVAAVVTGRLQRIGEGYSLYAEIRHPRDGTILATDIQESPRREDLPAVYQSAAVRLAEELRAGRHAPTRPRSASEEVTTSSTEAYRHYVDSGDLVFRGRRDAGLQELRQAIALDPRFATARMRLAMLLRGQGEDESVWLPHAERAFELRHEVSERERIYIEGLYFHWSGDYRAARSSYYALLALSPNDPRPSRQLAYLLPNLSHWSDAALQRARVADAFPNSPEWAAMAWEGLAIWRNDPEAGEPYRQRVLDLTKDSGSARGPEIAYCKTYPVFQSWLAGDVEAMLRAADEARDRARQAEAGGGRDAELFAAASWFILLGMLEEAERTVEITDLSIAGFPALAIKVYYLRGEDEAYRELLRQMHAPRQGSDGRRRRLVDPRTWPWLSADWTSRNILQLAEAGLPELGALHLRAWSDAYGFEDQTGYMAIAAHVLRDAGQEATPNLPLETALKRVQYAGRAAYFLGSEHLARRYRDAGQMERALRVLDDAARQRPRAYPRTPIFWLRLRAEQARLSREAGRADEARAIEEELRGLLRHADPNHRILRGLGR